MKIRPGAVGADERARDARATRTIHKSICTREECLFRSCPRTPPVLQGAWRLLAATRTFQTTAQRVALLQQELRLISPALCPRLRRVLQRFPPLFLRRHKMISQYA